MHARQRVLGASGLHSVGQELTRTVQTVLWPYGSQEGDGGREVGQESGSTVNTREPSSSDRLPWRPVLRGRWTEQLRACIDLRTLQRMWLTRDEKFYKEFFKPAFDLIGSGAVVGIFIVDSDLSAYWCERVKPLSLEELAVTISLVRPGCLDAGISEEYCRRKQSKSTSKSVHPILDQVLSATHGLWVFQEQLLEVAKELTGWSLGKCDELRYAISKKKPEMMSRLREEFINDCVKKGSCNKSQARQIFDLAESAQRYLFNKAHATQFALKCLQDALIKAHEPELFYATHLNLAPHDNDRWGLIRRTVYEARRHGIRFRPPDITKQQIVWTPSEPKIITAGWGMLRSVSYAELASRESKPDRLCDLVSWAGKTAYTDAWAGSGALSKYHADRYLMAIICRIYRMVPQLAKYGQFKLDKILEGLKKLAGSSQKARQAYNILSNWEKLAPRSTEYNINAMLDRYYTGITVTGYYADRLNLKKNGEVECRLVIESVKAHRNGVTLQLGDGALCIPCYCPDNELARHEGELIVAQVRCGDRYRLTKWDVVGSPEPMDVFARRIFNDQS